MRRSHTRWLDRRERISMTKLAGSLGKKAVYNEVEDIILVAGYERSWVWQRGGTIMSKDNEKFPNKKRREREQRHGWDVGM